MVNVDLASFDKDDLMALRDKIATELKTRRENALEDEREAKAEREAKFKGNVSEGDTILFLFNKEEVESEVVRASEKSVTVDIDGKKKYIAYNRILSVIAEAEVEATDEADEASEGVA